MDWCAVDEGYSYEQILTRGVVSQGRTWQQPLPNHLVPGHHGPQANPLEGQRGGQQPARVRRGFQMSNRL